MNNLHITITEFRNESRVLKEAESLLRSGLFSTVFIAALHTDGLFVDQSYGDRIHVHRFRLTTRSWGGVFFIQLLKYLEFLLRVFLYYRRYNIKVINVHSLAVLPIGFLLKHLHSALLVYDTHELETEKDGDKGLKKKLGKLLERLLIKSADLTIVVSKSIAQWYTTAYKIPPPIIVLNAPKLSSLRNFNHFRSHLGIRDNQIIVLYQGGLVPGRGVSLILDAFKARTDDRVVVVFMGYGQLESDIISASMRNNNIFFYPAVSPEDILQYTSSADIGIHLIQKTCINHDYCMPNKLFEYSMAGLPVLVSNMKDMSELVKNNSMGVVIDDYTPHSINQAVDYLLSTDLQVMRNNAYSTACSHAWEVQESRMLEAYARLNINPT